MILPDLNLLLYAYNPHMPQHARAHAWWSAAVNGTEIIGLPLEITLGFVRIATNPRLDEAAVSLQAARATVESWMALPHVRTLMPGPNHFGRVMDLMAESMAVGAVLSDAALAVYAIEARATLYSNDTDFARFSGLSWINPLAKV